MTDSIFDRLLSLGGMHMTDQRRIIARALEPAADHPDVEELHARATSVDPGNPIATVHRTVKLLKESGLPDKLEFGDCRAP